MTEKKASSLKVGRKASLSILFVASFVLALSTAIPAYVNSSFVECFVEVKYVGLFFAAANIVLASVMLLYPRVIEKLGNFVSTQSMIFLNALALIVIIFSSNPWLILPAFILMWVSSQLIWNNMDIFVESFTRDVNTGKIRTIFFTFMNLGWIFSPLIASRLVGADDYYNPVYFVSIICLILFYIIIVFNRKKVSLPIRYSRIDIKNTAIDFWKKDSFRGIYSVSFLLNLFYSSAVVYIPIYLHNNLGFDWSVLGIMFSIMLIPFVLIEIPAGIVADKYLGEKELMNVGFVILIISLLLFFTVKSANPVVWGAILFFSRVGSALIEAMRESRFFKMVDAKDISHINFLRTSYPLGYLVGSGLGVLLLSFFEIQYLFLFLAVIFLYSFYFTYIIKDSR